MGDVGSMGKSSGVHEAVVTVSFDDRKRSVFAVVGVGIASGVCVR